MNALIPNLPAVFTLLTRKFPKFFGHDQEPDGRNLQNRHKQNSFFRKRAIGEKQSPVGSDEKGSCRDDSWNDTFASTNLDNEEIVMEEKGGGDGNTQEAGGDVEKGNMRVNEISEQQPHPEGVGEQPFENAKPSVGETKKRGYVVSTKITEVIPRGSLVASASRSESREKMWSHECVPLNGKGATTEMNLPL